MTSGKTDSMPMPHATTASPWRHEEFCLTPHALLVCLLVLAAQAADDYVLGPDSQFKAAVPHGRIERFQFTNSTVFPGTVRDGGVYIPAQYDPSKPVALMVFQDGMGYLNTNGGWRVPLVFDNLIAAKEMPVTVGIFLNPGMRDGQSNRSFEYDSL